MKRTFTLLLSITILFSTYGNLCASGEKHSSESHDKPEKFNPSTFILHHIADSYEWVIYANEETNTHVSIPLPVIVYSEEKGFHAFLSSKLSHEHDHLGFSIPHHGQYSGKLVEKLANGNTVRPTLDVSITKNIASMMISVAFMLWLFLSMAKAYRKRGIAAPKGLQGFMEPIVIFVRDNIAKPNISKYEKFLPYLLTVFFFIWINNLLGLIPFFPGGSNVTGNIAVTFVLAFITMVITNVAGNKNYWKHIFNTPGVPWWLKFPIPIMPLVEIVGILSKPFALMVRLFANITAGHIIILSLVSIIFIFKNAGMAAVSVPFALFMNVLELLVAVLQAYVFTLLSALFIGLATEEHH